MLHIKKEKDCESSSDSKPPVAKTAKYDQITVRVLMNEKEVDAVIGKNGETIKELMKKTECNIYFTDETTFGKILCVIGTLNDVFQAFSEITRIKEECSALCDKNKPKMPLMLKMIVPSSQCGIIIGKGGTTIKDISERSKCSILISADMLPHSTEKIVSLSGSALSISTAIFEIHLIVSSVWLFREPVIPLESLKTEDVKISDNVLAPNKELADLSSALGKSTVKELLLLINQFKYEYKNARKMRGLTTSDNKKIVKNITIPEDYLAVFIGTHGRTINSIKTITKTQIKIRCPEAMQQDDDGTLKRPVMIKGFPESVATAEYLIDLCLDFKANRDSKNLLLKSRRI